MAKGNIIILETHKACGIDTEKVPKGMRLCAIVVSFQDVDSRLPHNSMKLRDAFRKIDEYLAHDNDVVILASEAMDVHKRIRDRAIVISLPKGE